MLYSRSFLVRDDESTCVRTSGRSSPEVGIRSRAVISKSADKDTGLIDRVHFATGIVMMGL